MTQTAIPVTDWGGRLRAAGLRKTQGRLAALQFLHEHPHSSAASVHRALASQVEGLTLQSAHNIVRDLTAHGLLRRIELPGHDSSLYEARVDDNHHHAVCSGCGVIVDIDCVTGEAPCLAPEHAGGMRIHAADVTFRGTCASCQANEDS